MMPKRWMLLVAHMVLGSCLALVALSWMPLWRVQQPIDHLGEIGVGTFWQFLDNLPGALENLSVPQEPIEILTILPTVYLSQNVRTTLVVLAVGAVFGIAVWRARQWGRPRL